MLGLALAIFGASIAVAGGCIGSSVGVATAGQAASGLISEKPDEFGKALVLQSLPGTQGIYGFLVAFLIMQKIGILGGVAVEVTTFQGLQLLATSLAVGLAAMASGMYQGKVSASGIHIIAKQPDATGKAIILAALVETYAILGLLVSLLLVFGIKVG